MARVVISMGSKKGRFWRIKTILVYSLLSLPQIDKCQMIATSVPEAPERTTALTIIRHRWLIATGSVMRRLIEMYPGLVEKQTVIDECMSYLPCCYDTIFWQTQLKRERFNSSLQFKQTCAIVAEKAWRQEQEARCSLCICTVEAEDEKRVGGDYKISRPVL